jgi:hypothetical protein
MVGATAPQGVDPAIDRALVDEDRWVVQQVAIPVKTFHVLDESDQLHVEPFYIVRGFAPSRYGVALVARTQQAGERREARRNVRRDGECEGVRQFDAADTVPATGPR